MSSNGISTLTWKRDRQVAKLDLASTNRANSGRPDQYDLQLLPAVYAEDDNNQANRIKNGSSVLGRPWLQTEYTESGLVTYFDPEREISGTTVFDQSSESQNGALVNGVTHDLDDATFTLDGVNDYIRTADLYALIGNPDTFSFGIWVKPTSSGVVLQVTNTAAPAVSYHFSAIEFVESAGNPVPYFGLWNGLGITNDSGSALSYNTWYHMALTYNGTAVKGYINGTEVATANVTYDSPHDDGETDHYLLIGPGTLTNQGDGGYLAGDIGEIRVYSDALTPSEVANNYNSTKTRYGY